MIANIPCMTKKAVPEKGSMVVKYSFIERPRSRSTKPNSAVSRRKSAMHPTPSRPAGLCGMANFPTTQRAAKTTTPSMIGISISSANLVPTCGTSHRMRTGPSMTPAPNTSAKYSTPAFTTCLILCLPLCPSLNVLSDTHLFPSSKHCICLYQYSSQISICQRCAV